MIPVLLGILAVSAAGTGICKGIDGAVKMSDAKDLLEKAKKRNDANVNRCTSINNETTRLMDSVGKMELEILSSFDKFANYIEKIQNRPKFADVKIRNVLLPKFEGKELKDVSIGATVLLSASTGAGVGTLGGFAAAGATTAAVTALGTASTGTAIAGLSGAAATNAVLATLGGGTLAAGGGGVAFGSALLSGATLGVGLLIGGWIFSYSGDKLLEKADDAWEQMLKNEDKINKICNYLGELKSAATNFKQSLNQAKGIYDQHLDYLRVIIRYGDVDWRDLNSNEQMCVQNTVLLVGLLYKMCKIKLVKNYESASTLNEVNKIEVNKAISDCNAVLREVHYVAA